MYNHIDRSNMNMSEGIKSSHINSSVISFYLFDLWELSVWAFSLPANAQIQLCITMNTQTPYPKEQSFLLVFFTQNKLCMSNPFKKFWTSLWLS